MTSNGVVVRVPRFRMPSPDLMLELRSLDLKSVNVRQSTTNLASTAFSSPSNLTAVVPLSVAHPKSAASILARSLAHLPILETKRSRSAIVSLGKIIPWHDRVIERLKDMLPGNTKPVSGDHGWGAALAGAYKLYNASPDKEAGVVRRLSLLNMLLGKGKYIFKHVQGGSQYLGASIFTEALLHFHPQGTTALPSYMDIDNAPLWQGEDVDPHFLMMRGSSEQYSGAAYWQVQQQKTHAPIDISAAFINAKLRIQVALVTLGRWDANQNKTFEDTGFLIEVENEKVQLWLPLIDLHLALTGGESTVQAKVLHYGELAKGAELKNLDLKRLKPNKKGRTRIEIDTPAGSFTINPKDYFPNLSLN